MNNPQTVRTDEPEQTPIIPEEHPRMVKDNIQEETITKHRIRQAKLLENKRVLEKIKEEEINQQLANEKQAKADQSNTKYKDMLKGDSKAILVEANGSMH